MIKISLTVQILLAIHLNFWVVSQKKNLLCDLADIPEWGDEI
jgi:hypothetical protein